MVRTHREGSAVRWERLLVPLLLVLLAVASARAASEPAPPPVEPEMRLRIEGLDGHPALLANVRALVPEPRFACPAPRVRVHAYLRQARQQAQSALRALGRFNARVETRVKREGQCLVPLLSITPGPAAVVETVDIVIDGPFAQDAEARRFMEGSRLEAGAPLDQGLYDAVRDGLINRARARGYLDARYTRRRLWVDPSTNRARVELTLVAGDRYRFGDVRAAQDILDPSYFRRLMPVRTGDPYSSDRLAEIGRALTASGYFADVRVRPDLDGRADGEVPVDVHLTPRKRTGYRVRVGYGTDTGPRARAEVDRRRVTPQGHKWNAGVGLAPRRQSLDTLYSIPLERPLTDSLDFYGRTDREDNNDIVTDSATLGVQYGRLRDGWTQALFGENLYERSRYGDGPPQDENFLLAGVKLGRRELDDPLFPVRGYSLDVVCKGAAEPLFSATSLVQGRLRVMGSIPWRRFVLQARAEAGALAAGDFGRVPKSLRFFAGGDNSVRGYDYESLAPKNAQGQEVGGRHLAALSLEGMHPVYGDDWFAALFADSGNAFDRLDHLDLQTGIGVGVRWRSPIGLVRVDVAYPLDADDPSPRLHLGIGADF